jgi:hypothetical protein
MLAKEAPPARDDERHDDTVTRLQVADLAPNLDDFSHEFMA